MICYQYQNTDTKHEVSYMVQPYVPVVILIILNLKLKIWVHLISCVYIYIYKAYCIRN
jgi:hypothetical protein